MRGSILLLFLLAPSVSIVHAGILERGRVLLICHRTANRDSPENTLESLDLAARMGCNIVEVDVRRTLDGQLVLNHDDYLERLTGGMGDVELTSSDELGLLDTGAWMGQRFSQMRIPLFEQALELARERGIGLALDLKSKGIAPLVLAALEREGMLERVTFGGEWDDVPPLYPDANRDPVASVEPGVDAGHVASLHREGNFVVANFSANSHEMDLPAMRAAVAAGVDAISVDYPRLGADAVGRPVEARLAVLARQASSGSIPLRVEAIRELSHYPGFPTRQFFEHWLRDPDDRISRAAAVALVIARPQPPIQVFIDALAAPQKTARQNAAWAIGMLGAPATASLLALLSDKDPEVLKEALLALSRCPGEVPADRLRPFLGSEIPTVRGAAALALARHQPAVAARAIQDLLARDEQESAREYAQYVSRGKPRLTQQEIDPIVENYREQMKLIQALALLSPKDALHSLAAQAFRSAEDPSGVTALVAGYQLWDRIAVDPGIAIRALDSSDNVVADRAEWILVQAGPPVLPALREALNSADQSARQRLIRILAWQCDSESLPALRKLQESDSQDAALIDWAIDKINVLVVRP
jgi:glycerophosphoryl diester phosphodiesterase